MSTLRNMRQNLPVIAPIVALVVLILIGIALNPNCLSYANITNVLARSAFIGIIAIGMTFVITAGGLDLSVGSMAAFVAGLMILVMNLLTDSMGQGLPVIVIGIGLALGYRPEAGLPGILASFALLLAIGFGWGWIFIVLGLVVRTPMTVMTLGFAVLFPVTFASNIMVDPATMPGWLQAFVAVNPVSLMTTALRALMAGTAGWGESGRALLAPAILTALLAPLVLWLYRRR